MTTNYKQNDPRWAWKAYAGESMAAAGCGPTSVADLLNVLPPTIADWMTANGYASNGSGTYASGCAACLRAYGHESKLITPYSQAGKMSSPYFDTFFESIRNGNCGILLMGGTAKGCRTDYWSYGGHYIAIVGYDSSTGKYLVYDPIYAKRDGWHNYNDFVGDIKHVITSNVKWGGGKKDAIVVDGKWGIGTTKYAQKIFGTVVDGEVSNQNEAMKKFLPGCMPASWKFVPASRLGMGSALIRAIQNFLGIKADGFMGNKTIVALQKYLGVAQDGYFGTESVKAFQRWLNKR